jgi:cytochrome c
MTRLSVLASGAAVLSFLGGCGGARTYRSWDKGGDFEYYFGRTLRGLCSDPSLRENVMRKAILASALAAATLLWGAAFASAQQFGTAAEARAMLDRAVTELKANEAAAIAKFNDKDNKQFHDRDLYVFCYNMSDGKFTAHPNPALMGTDVRALKLGNDPLGQRIFDQIKPGTVSTVSYSFPKPGTTDPAPKESYVTQVGNQGCGVGYYK